MLYLISLSLMESLKWLLLVRNFLNMYSLKTLFHYFTHLYSQKIFIVMLLFTIYQPDNAICKMIFTKKKFCAVRTGTR